MVLINFLQTNKDVQELISTTGEKIFRRHLEIIIGSNKDLYYYSFYRNNIFHSLRIFDEGILFKNKETRELEGFILVGDSLFLKEKEILVLCSTDIKIIFKLLKRFLENATLHGPANIYSYVTDNDELKAVYQELGFVIEKVLPRRFSEEPNLVLMRFNNEEETTK